ncbi:hypothetical protein ABZ771_27500 [Streptomyces globisporus]|uniref:hypothetical protein n=1 Tax=Streptomyces TaxID=1883 RepID=UPI000BF019D9|nr:hypothetical protein [Streptomyces sp. st170]WSF74807.1 hypothetical protein OG838_01040 [Streptomyces globisporus]WSQ90071.1 hypothetical protein OG425_01120 [Streptomyces globisporus]WSU79357.1 hypothetical protein OG215_01355 [Streptomyces globisporus]WSV88032.1 hypothetical protein OG449_01195 [Streptomyces globisporus]GGW04834.1 hypothetical protein GCM10010264_22770 [Streptomyces globisporus]
MGAIDGGAAFLRMLTAAERRLAVLRALTARRRRVRRPRIASAALAVLIPAVLALAAATGDGPGGVLLAVGLSIAVLSLAACAALLLLVERPLNRRFAVEEHAMIEEVNRMRELFTHVAERDRWEERLKGSVRERLSRFPVEGGSLR